MGSARPAGWSGSLVLARPLRYLVGVVGLALGYYVAGQASLALQYEGPVAAIWLPVGVGAATLYLAGLRWWPGVVLGDVALADPAQPLAVAAGITVGNVADILVIALGLRVLVSPRGALDRLEDVRGMLVAIVAGAAVTATVAVLSMRPAGLVAAAEVPTLWRSWFLADASGALVMIPLALAWAPPRFPAWRGRTAWEGALVMAAVAGLSALALSGDLPLMYLVFPALIWAALRFGQPGATLAVAVSAAITVGMTANDIGAFVEHSITESALSTQLYVAVAALTTLCLATIVSERRRAALELAESRARIAAARERERRRLEGELHDSAQNRIFALRVRLRLAQERAAETTPELDAALGELIDEAGAVGDDLRRIARGLSPPMLSTHGLAEALRVESSHSAIPVTIVADRVGTSEPHVERAVYLCCLESIQNAAKHAGKDATVTIRLQRHRHQLRFSVADTGVGFDPRTTLPGAGLASIYDRVDTVRGHVEVRAAPGYGTTVTGTVPWPPRG